MWQFILFRGLQGLGGGAVFPVALAVVADLYTPAERGKYLGLFGAVFGVSSLLGPGIGGFITDTFWWHWIFFVNVPIGIDLPVILWRLLPAIKRPEAAKHIDYVGALVFTLAIAPFLIGLTNKAERRMDGSDRRRADPGRAGVRCACSSGSSRGRRTRSCRCRSSGCARSAISVTAMFLAAFGFFGAVIFLPRWFQTVAGASATESGYNILPAPRRLDLQRDRIGADRRADRALQSH